MVGTPQHPAEQPDDGPVAHAPTGAPTEPTDTGAITWAASPDARSTGAPTAAAADSTTTGARDRPDPSSAPPVETTLSESAAGLGEKDHPGWRVGSLGGIPVYIGGGWVVIAIAMAFLFGPQVQENLPHLGAVAYLVALIFAALLLLSVLVHEAAHAVVARRCGYAVHRVVADLMGGHTSYDASRATPGRSALVAVVGPLANAVLAGLAWLLLPLAGGDGGGVGALLIAAFAWTNGFVALFNLLPGLPLDGGFIVDAAVWKITGKRHLGLLAAGWAGRIVTVIAVLWFIGMPFLRGEPPSLFTVLWTALIGAFLWAGATRAVQTGRMRGKLAAQDLADLVLAVTPVEADAPLTQLRGIRSVAVVMNGGTPIGVLDPEALEAATRAGRLDAPMRSCLRAMPPTWIYEIAPGTHDLGPVVDAMVERRVGALVLCTNDGRPHGILDGSAVGAAL